jgi:hypothetical protein
MWAHYADGERGIVIGIKNESLMTPTIRIRDINYSGILDNTTEDTTAEEILSCKNKEWKYEEEVRIFSDDKYINIEIEEIIMGSRLKPQYKRIIEELKDKVAGNFKIRSLKSVLDR